MRIRKEYKRLPGKIRYRVVGDGAIEVDLNFLLSRIAEYEKYKYRGKQKLRFIGYVKDNRISEQIFKLRYCDTNAVNIRTNFIEKKPKSLPVLKLNGEVSSHLKSDFDKVQPHSWSDEAFLHYWDNQHTLAYGIGSVEVYSGSKTGVQTPKGKMKYLINKFIAMGFTKNDVSKYIQWVFKKKATKSTVGLGFALLDSVIQEFLIQYKRENNRDGGRKDNSKWG